MNIKNPKGIVVILVALTAGFIAACQNQPRVLPLTPTPDQVASTEIKDPPAPTPSARLEIKSEPAPPNEAPTTQLPEKSATPSERPASEPAKEKPQQDLFADIAKILQHPRCLNCHVAGDTPKQGDDRHDHLPPVKRGPDGRGSGLTWVESGGACPG